MKSFLEDGLLLNGLELGLEAGEFVGVGAAVGAAAGVGEVIAVIHLFVAWTAPVRETVGDQ